MTVLGVSPRFLAEVQGRVITPCGPSYHTKTLKLRQHPVQLASFEALRAMLVTGAVLTAPLFQFAHEAFGKHIHIASVSGGTDICGGCE